MTDLLKDRWMPRSGVRVLRHRAAERCAEEKRDAIAASIEARRARPRFLDGEDGPERMQGSMRLR